MAIGRHGIESRILHRQISILKRYLWLQNKKIERKMPIALRLGSVG